MGGKIEEEDGRRKRIRGKPRELAEMWPARYDSADIQ